ncbi:YopX family protein [Jannaschia formosa]|uniref:YopX family protein n=1 Tax=Jannaschia formosa TaxID=2259592 RepID=UPI000E1B7FC9|nr:YopX family protein [Jannaschia formosa]TFL15928.1 hypothetical protein DR046_22795 [Jannaschia formosa]
MKREIKFRAWDKADKMMYYDIIYGIEFEDGSKYDFCNFIGEKDPSDYHEWVSMQYTGIKDKNGREIYEGGVLHYGYYGKWDGVSEEPEEDLDRPMNFEVRWSEAVGGFVANGYVRTSSNLGEVIGNIYEDPELLKK